MNKNIYCIRDVYNSFYAPILDSNDDSAKRNFAYAIQNNGVMNFAPRDYELYFLGFFDIDKGIFDTDLPRLVCRGSDVIGVNVDE